MLKHSNNNDLVELIRLTPDLGSRRLLRDTADRALHRGYVRGLVRLAAS
jgi:hypothetical protein